MPNPFQQRASEYQRSEAEFLATLAPSLFRMTLDQYGDPQELLTKTVTFSAPPGAGKTTLARFFQFATLRRLLEQVHRTSDPAYEELLDFASERGFIEDDQVIICGARISLERDYRELDLIGYSQQRAHELLLSLLGARAIRAWRQMFLDAGIRTEDVNVIPTAAGAARLAHLGGPSFDQLAQRASEVEATLYELTANFVPPPEDVLLQRLGGQFYPLLAIESFALKGVAEPIRPLLMLDDAHWMNRTQRQVLMTHLTLREVTIARWILQRMDALDPSEALMWKADDATSPIEGIQMSRSVVDVRMTQAPDDKRGAVRRNFRRAASEIASRYMVHIPELSRSGITTLSCLDVRARSTSRQQELARQMADDATRELGISHAQVDQIWQRVYAFLSARQHEYDVETIAPAMVSILLHRQNRRARQGSLFDQSEDESLAEEVLVDADVDVAAGAQIQLCHKCDVPYLGGADVVADLGMENAETFLQLSWQLVRLLETQEILRRDQSTSLSVKQQHDALVREGQRIVSAWSFPHAVAVRRLVSAIAEMCIARSLLPNAPLGGGANAIGIECSAFGGIMEYGKLVEALRFGVGYNAFTLVHGRKTKGKYWSILELGGPVIAAYRLTPRRGGFIPIDLTTLVEMLGEGA